jgi:hypothetical protein
MITDTDSPQKGPSMLHRLHLTRTLVRRDTPSPSPRTGVIALAATLAFVLVAGGCGSSSKSSTSASTGATTPTLSKTQFLAQGNAICAQGNQRLGPADKALGNQPSRGQITAFVASAFAPDIQGQIDGMRALRAPSSEQATVSTMLDTAQSDLNKIKGNPALLAGGSGFADFARLAHPYGLTACAAGS